MTMQTFGQFLDDIPDSQEYLTLNFAPTSAPQRQQRWHNNGLSADFLGDYFATFFPGEPVLNSEIDLKGTVKATVSYIANELLENAFKYSDELANLPITITLRLYDREILFQVTNYANQAMAQHYQAFVQKIESTDLD
ncbi:MAG: ATP-binding protein, partial [Acaryochloridaceae cyanobacterium CSU_3_4]|nr:ATP-binding protein [Acaryochloridaceae cyanobacterium CSU_3_4]